MAYYNWIYVKWTILIHLKNNKQALNDALFINYGRRVEDPFAIHHVSYGMILVLLIFLLPPPFTLSKAFHF